MKIAYELAKKAASLGEVPVGCVIVKNNEIIAQSHNTSEAHLNPLEHAEMNAINMALLSVDQHYLDGCDIYVTLEPCAMCAQAISLVRIRRVYFAASDEKSGGLINGARVYDHKTCHHKPEVYGGIMEQECKDLLTNFFKGLRKSKN
jgi:tRNA(adenine34) deaminase